MGLFGDIANRAKAVIAAKAAEGREEQAFKDIVQKRATAKYREEYSAAAIREVAERAKTQARERINPPAGRQSGGWASGMQTPQHRQNVDMALGTFMGFSAPPPQAQRRQKFSGTKLTKTERRALRKLNVQQAPPRQQQSAFNPHAGMDASLSMMGGDAMFGRRRR